MVRRAAKSPYRFRLKELWEAGGAATRFQPPLQEVSRDGEWLLLGIEDFRFFWPARYSTKGLRWMYREVFAGPPSNPHAFEVGHVRIKAGEWVVDGGACEGFFTAYALSKGANVLAVEPVGLLCEGLNRTFQQDVRRGRVIVLNAALASSEGTRAINVNPLAVYRTEAGASGPESVRAVSIDQIVAQGLVPDVGFIKMDIENGELDALRGSAAVMQTSKPRLSIAVYHDVANAAAAKRLLHATRPDYRVSFRGVYTSDGCTLRPYMLLAH